MPSNLTPAGRTTRVIERDSDELKRFWRAFDTGDPIWIGRWAFVVAIMPRADGAWDVEFEEVTRQ